jgi:hypothetical protein
MLDADQKKSRLGEGGSKTMRRGPCRRRGNEHGGSVQRDMACESHSPLRSRLVPSAKDPTCAPGNPDSWRKR